jgi:hypothetical protein
MSNRIRQLNDLLVEALIEDLSDPEKRGPGLYGVIARVVSDNKDRLTDVPAPKAETLESLAPFKIKMRTAT